ncbi:hypothetical protein JCM10213_007865 [Rhodosporidiobolus nylandii]
MRRSTTQSDSTLNDDFTVERRSSPPADLEMGEYGAEGRAAHASGTGDDGKAHKREHGAKHGEKKADERSGKGGRGEKPSQDDDYDPHAAQDRPHHVGDRSPSGDPRPETEEPPLETGQPYVSPSEPGEKPQEVIALFEPWYPKPTAYSLLILGTIWGVLARLGLQWIGGFSSREVFALVWAQMVGCAAMGLVIERKRGIERIFPPLFVLCGTAFCGSLTTWSTMSRDVFAAFANLDQPAGTSRFSGFLSGAAITVITLIASMTSLQFGVHLSSFLPRVRIPHRRLRPQGAFNALALSAGPLFWLGALFLLIFGPASYRSRATFAIVLGPPGTMVRYTISKMLNPRSPSLPIGTLTINTLAVLIFAVAELLARHPRGQLGCAALKGVQDGFCGSLSTISTMAVELRGLKRAQSYRYFALSWIAAQLALLVVVGSWVWTGDRGETCWNR